MPLVRQSLQNLSLSKETANIIIGSWKTGTKKQSKTYLQRWLIFCRQQQDNPFSPTLKSVLDFLTQLYAEGKQYSSLNTARSAFSSVITLARDPPIGKHPLVSRFMKGVFQARPVLPRCTETWDVGEVLNHLRSLVRENQLSLKQLTLKLTMRLALLSGQRTQTIASLDIHFLTLSWRTCCFVIREPLKHTRPGTHQVPLELPAYPQDRAICIVSILKDYLETTKSLRKDESKLLSFFSAS